MKKGNLNIIKECKGLFIFRYSLKVVKQDFYGRRMEG